MRLAPGWRVVAWWLVALVLMDGCATVPLEGIGGSGRPAQRGPLRGSSEWDGLEEARAAELESALVGMWAVASEVREVGALLEFTFWTESGALTLLSLRRREKGGAPGSTVDREAFMSDLEEFLPLYSEGAAGAVRLSLRREEGRWRADFHMDTEADFPLEAKTWPVQRAGVRTEVLEGLVAAGREVASRVWVPAGAEVRWQVEVELDDERVIGLETWPPNALPGGKSVRASPELVGTWVNVLMPFAQGLGPRKVRMEWEGSHTTGPGLSRWKIVTVEVIRPAPPEPQNAEVVLEYRAMHERIQREWREETSASFQAAGLFTAEQVALWVVGGLAARGMGVVVEAAAPTIARVVARGGTQAVGWFRSLLARAAPAEKQAFARLVAKAETQGLEALTVAERNELKTLFVRLESRMNTPLNQLGNAKEVLRSDAKVIFYEKLHPELAMLLRDINGVRYDIHHCLPLEYAHLFPLRDVNAELNLVAAARPVHSSVGSVWTRLRQAPRAPTVEEVQRVEESVRKYFGRWFNRAYDGSARSAEELAAAQAGAIEEVNALLAVMH